MTATKSPKRKPAARQQRAKKPAAPAGATTPLSSAFDAALDRLRWQQRLFVREYLVDRNGAAAYRRAGYRAKTAEAASANASHLTAVHSVAEAVRLGIADIDARLGLDAEVAARENFALATASPSDVMTWSDNGVKIIPSNEIPERARAALKKVRIKRTLRPDPSGLATHLIDELMEFEMHDKNSALERVLKMAGRLKPDGSGEGLTVHIIVEGTPGLIRTPETAGD